MDFTNDVIEFWGGYWGGLAPYLGDLTGHEGNSSEFFLIGEKELNDIANQATQNLPEEVQKILARPVEHLLTSFYHLAAAKDTALDPNSLVLVKKGGGGQSRVYLPALFREGGSIVIRFGNNSFPVEFSDKAKVEVGGLHGKFLISSDTDTDNNKYGVVYLYLETSSGVYCFKGVNSPDADFSPPQLETMLEEGRLHEALREVKSGGRFLKMRDLEVKGYAIEGVRYNPNAKYTKYSVVLQGLGYLEPNSKLLRHVVTVGSALYAHDPNNWEEELSQFFRGQSLEITEKNSVGGKVYANFNLTPAPAETPLSHESEPVDIPF